MSAAPSLGSYSYVHDAQLDKMAFAKRRTAEELVALSLVHDRAICEMVDAGVADDYRDEHGQWHAHGCRDFSTLFARLLRDRRVAQDDAQLRGIGR